MQQFKGLSASPGLVVGPIYRVHHAGPGLNRAVQQPAHEQALLDAALALARDELCLLEEKAVPGESEIFMFQRAMLDDPSLNREIREYIAAGAGCAAAVERAGLLYAERIAAINDDYLAQRAIDVLDVCRRVVNLLDGLPGNPIALRVPSILVATHIYPSDLVALGRGMVLGVVAAGGSPQSHAFILARSMHIPALVQTDRRILDVPNGTDCLLDADGSLAKINPDPQSLSAAMQRNAAADLQHP